MNETETISKVRELKELKAMADELAAEITAIEDTIKADMTAQGIEEMTVDIYRVRYKTVKSSRFHTTAFKKAMPDLAAQFMRETESRRFTVA